MGWMIYDKATSPRNHAEEKAEIEKLFRPAAGAGVSMDVLQASKVGAHWVCAIKITPTTPERREKAFCDQYYIADKNGAITFAAIIKVSRTAGEWGYKDMAETMGVYGNFDRTPASLIAKLSPLRDTEAAKYAREWRESICKARKAYKPQEGDVIRLAEAVPFASGHGFRTMLTLFRVTSYTRRGRNMRVYQSLEGAGLCRLRQHHLRGCIRAD